MASVTAVQGMIKNRYDKIGSLPAACEQVIETLDQDAAEIEEGRKSLLAKLQEAGETEV